MTDLAAFPAVAYLPLRATDLLHTVFVHLSEGIGTPGLSGWARAVAALLHTRQSTVRGQAAPDLPVAPVALSTLTDVELSALIEFVGVAAQYVGSEVFACIWLSRLGELVTSVQAERTAVEAMMARAAADAIAAAELAAQRANRPPTDMTGLPTPGNQND